MDFFNQLLNYLWAVLGFAGGVIAAFGVVRLVAAMRNHDSQAQESATWLVVLGGAMIAIGLVGGSYLHFPTF